MEFDYCYKGLVDISLWHSFHQWLRKISLQLMDLEAVPADYLNFVHILTSPNWRTDRCKSFPVLNYALYGKSKYYLCFIHDFTKLSMYLEVRRTNGAH